MNDQHRHPKALAGLLMLCGLVMLAVGWAALAASPSSAAAPHSPATALAPEGAICGPQWSQVPSPNVVATDHTLTGVAAVSATDVWAVGFYTNTNGVAQTLVERWNGTQWSIVPSPNVGSVGGNWLQAVSAVSSNDVWAVGYYELGGALLTLALHWNGTDWQVVTTPSPGTTENYVYGVAAVSANDVWAVGYYGASGLYRTLIMRWNGTAWNTVTSPNPGLGGGLRGITAVSANEVWAVGAYAGFTLVLQTLVVRWNGTTWSAVPSPNANTANTNALTAVSASGSGNIWAAGVYSDGSRFLTLTERWNGTAWSLMPSPNPGSGDNALGGVITLGATEAWAVGGYDAGARTETLTLRWDGAQWAQVPSDNPGSADNALLAAAASPTDRWAVGSYRGSGPAMTLVERYTNVPCPSGTPTSTPPAVTFTPTGTPSSTTTATQTPGGATPTPTRTPCPMTFTDVQPSEYFYEAVRYLYCAGVISGYSDNTFRPYNNTTRGQLTKIVTLAEGWKIYIPPQPTFSDVPATDTFYQYIETAYSNGIISGYSDGTFRPGNNVTRGQLSKIIVLAEEWALYTPPTPTFSDVPETDAFYAYIETAYSRGIISGYADGTFRPGNNATRGQISKIVYNAVALP